MDSIYKTISLRLIRAISRALEQMEREEYAAAEQILREAWEKAAGPSPENLLLR